MIRHDGVKQCDCCACEFNTLYWYNDIQLCEDCWIEMKFREAEEVEDDD